MRSHFQDLVADPTFVVIWGVLVLLSLIWTSRDLATKNSHLPSLMKAVWWLTVLYSGPLGVLLYVWSGRRQISRDTSLRRAGRSVAHCYSGCGMGEVVGIVVSVGLLGWAGWPVAIMTFALAYVAGFALTVGPLVQEGMAWGQALKDAFESETASITVA